MALQGIEAIGKIIHASEPRGGVSKRTGAEWRSQDFVLEEQGASQFPRMCSFTVFGQDRLEQFKINVGDTVHVWLDINARAWEGRYFNDIRAYRVEHIDPNSVNMPQTAYPTAAPMPPTAAPAPSDGAPFDNAGDDESLPF